MKQQLSTSCLSPYLLDRLHLGEMSVKEQRSATRHLASCPHCQAQMAMRQAQIEKLHQMPLFDRLLHEGLALPSPASSKKPQLGALASSAERRIGTEERTDGTKERRSGTEEKKAWSELFAFPFFSQRWLWGGSTLVMGMMLLLFREPLFSALLLSPQTPPKQRPILSRPTPEPTQTPKGDMPVFRMLYFSKGAQHSQLARHGQALSAGDLIQFTVEHTRALHTMILSLNTKGVVSVVIPFEGKESRLLQAGKHHLPERSSLELDEEQGLEAYLFLTSATPFVFSQAKSLIEKAFVRSERDLLRLDLQALPFQAQIFLIQKR
jgi:hypothetical protein